jgi:hypothetical protein
MPLKIKQHKPAKSEVVSLLNEERVKLTALLNDPVFVKAWNNAEMFKPSAFPGGLDTALGSVIASNRLSQLQGWEMFKAALLRQVEEPKQAKASLQETYPG